MSRFSFWSVSAIGALLGLTGPAHAEQSLSAVPALNASSSAAVVNLQFIVNGKKTNTGNEVAAVGSAPPAYNKKTIRATYAKTSQILGGLTFQRSATTIESQAIGSATVATGVSASGEATVGAFKGTLTNSLGMLVTVKTGKITSQAKFVRSKAGIESTKGGVTISKLTIDAPALGIHEAFSGSPKVNQVLYRNSDNSIVIFLNRQITTKAGGKVVGFAVDAVDVQIKNFTKIPGSTITGAITVLPAIAR